jgi:hypothetical protein
MAKNAATYLSRASRKQIAMKETPSSQQWEYRARVGAVSLGNAFGLACIGGFLLWAYVDIDSLNYHALEDGIIENLTAVLFLLASIAMGIATWRHPIARSKRSRWRLFFLLGWVLLFFVFAGEEISWGQRIFGFKTPDFLKDNRGGQDELNVHNVAWVNEFMGGKYRWMSVLVLTTGVLMPLAKRSAPVRRVFAKIGMPVVQLHYVTLFLGGYLFARYTHHWIAHSDEVRELAFGLGYFLFGVHGAAYPLSTLDNVLPSTRGQASG